MNNLQMNLSSTNLLYSLRKNNKKVNEILELPENSIISNAYFSDNDLVLSIYEYDNLERYEWYINLHTSHRGCYIFNEENSGDKLQKLYECIKIENPLGNPPEKRRLDVFFCTVLLTKDKGQKMLNYIRSINKTDSNVSVFNLEVNMGNVIIGYTIDKEDRYLVMTGEAYRAFFDDNDIKEDEIKCQ